MDAYDRRLGALATARRDALVASLQRRFPRTPAALVEEAVQEALTEAADPTRRGWFEEGLTAGGDDELFRRLYTASWRRLRGTLRTVSHQRTARMDTAFDAPDGGPEASAGAEEAELRAWVDGEVADAADQFGRRRAATLHRALRSLVRAGHAVKPLAERYALPRRYLAEASAWLRRRIEDRDRD